ASNATATVMITVQVLQLGLVTNVAEVTAAEIDLIPSNNKSAAVTTLTPAVISAPPVSVTEGTLADTQALFNLRLNFSFSQTVSVSYATANLTAQAGVDYQASSGQVTFLPGETSKLVPVTILADALDETNETFTLNLFNPVNATFNQSQITATIIDDDA